MTVARALELAGRHKATRLVGECHCGLGGFSRPCACKKAVPNAYSREVYMALNTRGGAVWERLQKDSATQGDLSWKIARRISRQAKTFEDYSDRFGVGDSSLPVTKAHLELISSNLADLMKDREEDDQLIEKDQFVRACVDAGLEFMTRDELCAMFDRVDVNKSGRIDVREWLTAVHPTAFDDEDD